MPPSQEAYVYAFRWKNNKALLLQSGFGGNNMAQKKKRNRRSRATSSMEQPTTSKVRWKLEISHLISFLSVAIAAGSLFFSVMQRIDEQKAEQFKYANQAFVLNTIASDGRELENGEVGIEITSSFHNDSPNPLFNVVLSAPWPLDLQISAEHYHEFSMPASTPKRVGLPFPTLPPGGKVEKSMTYDPTTYANQGMREFLGANVYFCFTDVNGDRWMADNRGAHRISSKECVRQDKP